MTDEKRKILLCLTNGVALQQFINQHPDWSKEQQETIRKAWEIIHGVQREKNMGSLQEAFERGQQDFSAPRSEIDWVREAEKSGLGTEW